MILSTSPTLELSSRQWIQKLLRRPGYLLGVVFGFRPHCQQVFDLGGGEQDFWQGLGDPVVGEGKFWETILGRGI